MIRFIAALCLAAGLAGAAEPPVVSFAIVGDRTGNAQPGVYQHTWREIDRARPAFAINVGDSIQGGAEETAAEEWSEIEPLFRRKLRFYPVPGNHDIWSAASEKLWRKVTGRPPYYSFNEGGVHIVVLDNSRVHEVPDEQLAFLDKDLAAHAAAPVKLIFMHKPSWLTAVMFRNPKFRLQELAKKHGVAAVVAGHVHRFAWWDLEGVQYLMVGSSGGQLRGDRFPDGWFFHWVEARVEQGKVEFLVHELPAPDGEGRSFPARAWGSSGKLRE